MKSLIATLAVLLSVTLFTPGVVLGADTATVNDQQYVVGVSGVVGKGGCPKRIRASLKKMEGVTDVTFDAKKNEATITAKADAEITKESLKTAFKGTSYGVTSLKKKEAEGASGFTRPNPLAPLPAVAADYVLN